MKTYVPQIKRCSPVEISEEKYSSCVWLSSLRSIPSPWVNTSISMETFVLFCNLRLLWFVLVPLFFLFCFLLFSRTSQNGAKYSLNKSQFTDVYSCNIRRNGIHINVFLQFRPNQQGVFEEKEHSALMNLLLPIKKKKKKKKTQQQQHAKCFIFHEQSSKQSIKDDKP